MCDPSEAMGFFGRLLVALGLAKKKVHPRMTLIGMASPRQMTLLLMASPRKMVSRRMTRISRRRAT